MTRFVFLSDSHLGADPIGYQQQPSSPQRLPQLLEALTLWIGAHDPVDFVLHGGDMVERGDPVLISAAAVAWARLPVPVRLVLGNHDLTAPDARRDWLRIAPGFFPWGGTDYTLRTSEACIHVVTTHWEDEPFIWRDRQDAHFRAEQLEALERALTDSFLPHVLATHSPVLGLPPAQTGFDAPCHAPPLFAEQVTALATRHANLRLVLGGHNHMNMHLATGATHYATASAFVEAPYEFKVVTISGGAVSMRTVTLADGTNLSTAYNHDKSYVQGRPCDRGFGGESGSQ